MAESVDIVLKARDEATSIITKARGKIERQLKGFEKSFTELQSKMSFVGQAGRVALDSVRAAAKALKGDFEGVQEVVEALPLGIGEIATAGRELANELSGLNDEMARMKGLNERSDREGASTRRHVQKLTSAANRAESQIASVQSQTRTFGLTGLEAIEAQYREAQRRAMDTVNTLRGSVRQEHQDLADNLLLSIRRFYTKQAETFVEAERVAKAEAAKMREKQKQSVISSLTEAGRLILGARLNPDAPERMRNIQASPLAPVVEGSRLTGRTAAARADRQSEFIRRQAEQQAKQLKQSEKNGHTLGEILTALKNPFANLVKF